jgi:hypothetical protein
MFSALAEYPPASRAKGNRSRELLNTDQESFASAWCVHLADHAAQGVSARPLHAIRLAVVGSLLRLVAGLRLQNGRSRMCFFLLLGVQSLLDSTPR